MIKEAFVKRGLSYWVFTLVTALMSYGFAMTNVVINIDDEDFILGKINSNWLPTGRWLNTVLEKGPDTYSFLPVWRDIIAIGLMIFGVTLICLLFENSSQGLFGNTAATIFACVVISFPYLSRIYSFFMMRVEIGLIFALVAISAYYLYCFSKDKKWYYFFLCILPLACAQGTYEMAIVLFISIGFMMLFFYYLANKEKPVAFKGFFLKGVEVAALTVAGLFLSQIIGGILRIIYRLGFDNRAGSFSSYDFSSPGALFVSLLKFIVYFIPRIVYKALSDKTLLLVVISFTLIFIISLLLSIYRRNIVIFACGICVLISSCLIWFISGNTIVPKRTICYLGFPVAFAITVLYILLSNIRIKKVKLNLVVLVCAVGVVFCQTKAMNEEFYVNYQRYQRDMVVMNNIMHDLGAIHNQKKVVFVGLLDEYDLPHYEVTGYSFFNWDRQGADQQLVGELYTSRPFKFIKVHGYEIKQYKNANPEIIKEQIKGMKSYPETGYISDCGDYVIVKLGVSYLENKEP